MLLSYPLRFINANVRRSFTCVSRPFLLNYCVTFKCNMRCIHCGCADAQDSIETGEELNVQHINKMVHDPLLRDLNVIVISGGEPFLKKDLNDILLVFQKKYKPYRFHITSNGLLSEIISESLAFYLRHNMKIDLKISIDGTAEIHNHMRQTPGAFKSAVNTIEKLRSRYSRKQLYLAINHTLTNENYLCIEDMCKLAQDLDVDYRCFIALEKRPLYSNTRPIDYHVVKLTHTAKAAIVHQLDHLYLNTNWMKPSRDTLEKLVFRQYIGGQLKLLKNIRPHHRCMNLFTHFRLNPNGDIIPCSYDTKVLGNIKNETYSNVMAKQITKEKLRTIKKCGKCWLGCEVAPNWISSLGR